MNSGKKLVPKGYQPPKTGKPEGQYPPSGGSNVMQSNSLPGDITPKTESAVVAKAKKLPKVEFQVDLNVIKHAVGLFTVNGHPNGDVVSTKFDTLSSGIERHPKPTQQCSDTDELGTVKKLVSYIDLRMLDLFERLKFTEWLRKTNENIKIEENHITTEEFCDYISFLSLLIKDFHNDLYSIVKSLLKLKGHIKFDAIDESLCRWYNKGVNPIRNGLIRDKPEEYQRAIFGTPSKGIAFQIDINTTRPLIISPLLLRSEGNHVVDFGRYSAYILAELIYILDTVGGLLLEKYNISGCECYRVADFRNIINNMHSLIDALEKTIEEPNINRQCSKA